MRGYLYVFTNRHMPALVKIGYTNRSPQERADELSRPTGVPGRFEVAKSWLIDDAPKLERIIHNEFFSLRTSGEHFRLKAATAIERINVILRAAQVIGDDGLTAPERAEAHARIAKRQAEEARERERAQQAKAKQLADEEAEKQRQAEVLIYRQMHREAFWLPFFVIGIAGFCGGVRLAEQMAVRTAAGEAIVGLIGVAIAAGIASAWAAHAITARKAREARQAAKLEVKRAMEAAKTTEQAPANRPNQTAPGYPDSTGLSARTLGPSQDVSKTSRVTQGQQPKTPPQIGSRFVVTCGDLYGAKSRYILFDTQTRDIVFESDDKSEVMAEAANRQPPSPLPPPLPQRPRPPLGELAPGQLTLEENTRGRASVTPVWVPLKGHRNENSG
jgi:T5orf172 domain